MFSHSALRRFAALFALLVVLIGGLVSLGTYLVYAHESEQQLHARLSQDLAGLADIFAQRRLPGVREAVERRVERGSEEDGVYYRLTDKQGARLAGNIAAWPDNLPDDGSITSTDIQTDDGRRIPVVASGALIAGHFPLLVARSRAGLDASLSRLARIALAGLGATLILGLAGGWFAAGRLLARIDAINRTCEAVSAGDMASRAPGADAPDEFGLLARNINRMLERIDVLVSASRDLSDRIAHEMRTPLTRLGARLRRARTEAPEHVKGDLDVAVGEVENLVTIFQALLDIAAAERGRGDPQGLEPVDLAELIGDVVDLYEPVAEEKGIVLTSEIVPHPVMLGERMLLSRLIANLVDNAIKFTPGEGTVAISVERAGSRLRLSVRDEGPGISPAFRERAFAAFSRADEARAVPGYGLGLSLVRAIAMRHGMTLALTEVPEGGLCVILEAAAFDAKTAL